MPPNCLGPYSLLKTPQTCSKLCSPLEDSSLLINPLCSEQESHDAHRPDAWLPWGTTLAVSPSLADLGTPDSVLEGPACQRLLYATEPDLLVLWDTQLDKTSQPPWC